MSPKVVPDPLNPTNGSGWPPGGGLLLSVELSRGLVLLVDRLWNQQLPGLGTTLSALLL